MVKEVSGVLIIIQGGLRVSGAFVGFSERLHGD